MSARNSRETVSGAMSRLKVESMNEPLLHLAKSDANEDTQLQNTDEHVRQATARSRLGGGGAGKGVGGSGGKFSGAVYANDPEVAAFYTRAINTGEVNGTPQLTCELAAAVGHLPISSRDSRVSST